MIPTCLGRGGGARVDARPWAVRRSRQTQGGAGEIIRWGGRVSPGEARPGALGWAGEKWRSASLGRESVSADSGRGG
jgi:hypothetical protein